MRAPALVATALAVVLLTPAHAWAGPNGDGVCDLRPNDDYCVATTHTVARGEWLWQIARTRLERAERPTSARDVRLVAEMIHADNRAVIGRNGDRLRPGQRLTIRARQHWPV